MSRNYTENIKQFMKSINKSRLINFFVILAVILLLIFFNWRGLLAGPKSLAFFATSPFLKLFQAVDNGMAGAWGFLAALKDLNNENIILRSENAALVEQVASLKEAERENEVLRQQLGVLPPGKQKLVMARITGYNPVLGQYFLIDKGEKDGVAINLAVVAANNFLVGRVVEVNQIFSKVLLISDSNSSVNAITQESRVSGAVKGSHGLAIAMEMIPIDAQVLVGEPVLTSGLNDAIPRGLVIGRIASVVRKESEIFQRAAITPVLEFNKLEKVFVLLQ